MKILLITDYKINEEQLKSVKKSVSDIYKTNTGITLEFVDEWRDLSNVPKAWYDDEAEGIDKAYIAKVTKEVYARYREDIDQVMFLIHRDHWTLTGVWGWNLSRVYNGYGVQQCRFDNRNLVNSIGTMYHELMHDHDTFIYTYLGKNIEDSVLVKDWDDDVVHGGRYSGTTFGWKYIRHNENQEALKLIGPLLKEAVEKRRIVWLKTKLGYLQEIVRLYERVAILKRQLVAQGRGDLAIKPNQICSHSIKQS